MKLPSFRHYRNCAWLVAGALAAGCAATTAPAHKPAAAPAVHVASDAQAYPLLDRVTWGANDTSWQALHAHGINAYLAQQLRPGPAMLPAPVQAQIDAMTISRQPMESLVLDMESRRRDANAITNDDDKEAAKKAYQRDLNRLAHEAAARMLLRAVYSPNQLQEQMTWFWLNHFSVFQGKHDLRAMVGDYEEHAIHPHALGKFRDLLGAVAHHPAMLRYLDNEQNAVNHLNENYARELMELHTLGVDGGYTQQDVQQLARILTGLGVARAGRDSERPMPRLRRGLQDQYVRDGLFEFNPKRHDYGDKVLLGKTIHGRGLREVDEALDLLARHPSTAHFISRKLAMYFVSDNPPPALVERMAGTFLHSDGDIAQVLNTMLSSPEFAQSLGREFKDPMHYVVSAVRIAYDSKPILNASPMINWLQRMGEPLFGRQTPDGYPLAESAWTGSGQMTTRFEIAKTVGSGSAGLFRTDDAQPVERPAFPQLANALYYQAMQPRLGSATRQALEQAASPQEWNMFLLSSPEFMHR